MDIILYRQTNINLSAAGPGDDHNWDLNTLIEWHFQILNVTGSARTLHACPHANFNPFLELYNCLTISCNVVEISMFVDKLSMHAATFLI